MSQAQFITKHIQIPYTYYENENITFDGGFLIVMPGYCQITIRKQLSKKEKETAISDMANHLKELEDNGGGVYICSLEKQQND